MSLFLFWCLLLGVIVQSQQPASAVCVNLEMYEGAKPRGERVWKKEKKRKERGQVERTSGKGGFSRASGIVLPHGTN